MSAPTDDLPGASAPVLSAPLLAHIYELNLDYLDLLIAEHATTGADRQLHHLPEKLWGALAVLPRAARALLARSPFTLYSLGFEDESFWASACAATTTPIAQRYARAESEVLQSSFREIALLNAWHVASSNRLAARVLLAMSEATAHRFSGTPLWRIKRIACEHPALLMPRWPTNPCFWPDLLRFAGVNDTRRLAMVQLLGSQLIAAELECATGSRAPGGDGRTARSPRLRAHKLRFELRGR
jgi:hypothetical protein